VTRSAAPPAAGAAVPDRLTRSVWSSAGIVFVGNVIARGLGFAFPLVLARAVSRDDFALVYLFITTGFFVGELVLAGFPTSLTRYLAAPGESDRGSWFLSGLVAGLPLLLLSLGAGVLFAAQADADPWLLALVIVGLTIDAYYFSALRGLGRFSLLVGYRIGANLAQILALVAAWWLGIASVPLAVGIYALTYVVPIALIELRPGPVRAILGSTARPRRSLMGPLTRFAIPALVSGTAYAAILGLDV
jgi:O-antigen/teichoic acid export membrane protein